MLTASFCAPSPPLLSPRTQSKLRVKCSDGFGAVRVCNRIKSIGLGLELQPIVGRSRKQSFSVICAAAAAALNATCSASGQTQTVTREAPTITQAPVHSKEKSPQLDDGDSGFPPRIFGFLDGGGGGGGGGEGGGGGGGGGGGNWSGGFFFFGFLAFLGFLKDKDGEEDYRDSRT